MLNVSTRLITTTDQLAEIADDLLNCQYLAVDCETNGLQRYAEVVGISFATSPNTSYYIPIEIYKPDSGLIIPWSESAYEYVVNVIKEVLTTSKRLLTHNGVFDAKVIKNTFDVDIIPFIFADTQLLHHTAINESPPHGLKKLAVKYLDPEADNPQQDLKESVIANGGKWTKDDKDMYKGDWKLLGTYACFIPNTTYITMESGEAKLIEHVEIGDKVISHTGEARNVDNILAKHYEGDVYKLHIENGRTIIGATEEHPFLVMNQETAQLEWKKVKDIKTNDLLVKGDFKLNPSTTYDLSLDMWWLFGLYQAEGYIRVSKSNLKNVVFTVHDKEVDILTSVLDKNNLLYSVVKKKNKKGGLALAKDVVVSNKNLVDTFLMLSAGKHRSWDKKIASNVLKFLANNLTEASSFLGGLLDGDGSLRILNNRVNSAQLNFTVTSPHLSNIFDILCSKLGINCSRRYFEASNKDGINRKRRFTSYIYTRGIKKLLPFFKFKTAELPKFIEDESFIRFVRVVKVEKSSYAGPVYNISVNKDQSYIANGLISHNCYDVIYTRQLFDKFYPELLKSPKLIELWEKEVMPLMAVSYDLNTTGIKVDIPYFQNLKLEMLAKIKGIEDEIYEQLKDKISAYELTKMKLSVNITERSEFGRFLKVNNIWPWQDNSDIHNKALQHWYNKKHGGVRPFNLDSGDDKAFLLYDILELPVKQMTESGKRSTSKTVLDELANEFEDSSTILKLLRERSTELKLLSTYVDPILESNEDGKIYPSFNQTGTTSGRYSCGGSSMNLQTLPRKDKRIKMGFIPEEGRSFIAADYSSLEPHVFAFISDELEIKNIFYKNLDFYSAIAIIVFGLEGVSANPKDDNYLGKVDPEKRQWIKAIALSIPYGAEAGRLSQMMKISYEEAHELYLKYVETFPTLKKWMDKSNLLMKMNGYVESIVGRRKRNDTVYKLYNKHGIRDFTKKGILKIANRICPINGIEDGTALYLECRNAMNVAKNHQIQSLSASICNQAMVDFKIEANKLGLDAKLLLQIHDEIVLTCNNKDLEVASQLLHKCMINNRVTAMIDVPLKAQPVITDKNLAEAK